MSVTGLAGQGTIDLELFVKLINDAASAVVAVPPSSKTIRSVFHLATGGIDGALNVE